jgi:hypothetical protein
VRTVFLLDIEFADKILAEIVIKTRCRIRARACRSRIFGGNFAAPFRIEKVLGAAHFFRLHLIRIDEKESRDAAERPHGKAFLGIGKPDLAEFPLRAISDFGHDQQRFERIDYFFAVQGRGGGIRACEINIDAVNSRATLGFDPRADFARASGNELDGDTVAFLEFRNYFIAHDGVRRACDHNLAFFFCPLNDRVPFLLARAVLR